LGRASRAPGPLLQRQSLKGITTEFKEGREVFKRVKGTADTGGPLHPE